MMVTAMKLHRALGLLMGLSLSVSAAAHADVVDVRHVENPMLITLLRLLALGTVWVLAGIGMLWILGLCARDPPAQRFWGSPRTGDHMTTPFDEEERANCLQQIAILKARPLPGSNRDIAHEEEGSACTTDKILFVIA